MSRLQLWRFASLELAPTGLGYPDQMLKMCYRTTVGACKTTPRNENGKFCNIKWSPPQGSRRLFVFIIPGKTGTDCCWAKESVMVFLTATYFDSRLVFLMPWICITRVEGGSML